MDKLCVKRAILSVYDKTGLDKLARSLHQKGVELISTGGTALFLQQQGIATTKIEEINQNPEILDGRVKTLGFPVFGGILFERDNPSHQQEATKYSIPPIDLVVCNLYPFSKVSKDQKASHKDLIDNIDIGGVSLIRAASKNYQYVCVLSDPDDYALFLEEFERDQFISEERRAMLAIKGFTHTYHYDQTIALTLFRLFQEKQSFELYGPDVGENLRYGENPHQKAKLLSLGQTSAVGVKLHGKEMSYNNYLDADVARNVTFDFNQYKEFDQYHCVSIVKHGNPCGLCLGEDQLQSLQYAWQGDSVSAFGGILCFNSEVQKDSADWISQKFVEIIVAPSFSQEALTILTKKKQLRILKATERDDSQMSIRSICGGLLLQNRDSLEDIGNLRTVTKKVFDEKSLPCAIFGIIASQYLKSNAIALVRAVPKGFQLVGAGMGNPNRLESVRQAVSKAKENGIHDFGGVLAVSDAFFPFKDGVESLEKEGIKSVVQPGGSMRDKEVIEACDRLNMRMIFTGRRHFSH